MWVYLSWLQNSWVCRLILKTMPSCPELTSVQHFTISITAGSVEHSLLINGRLPMVDISTSRKFFSKCVNTFDNNHMWCLFFIWRHIAILKWTGATRCTLTMDTMWLLILIIHFFCSMTILLHIRQIGIDLIVFYLMFIKYGMRLYDYLLRKAV